jgi:membrane protease YdiL (CAAX protease family)
VHVLNGVPEQWYWAWGTWNIFSGLLLGLVREKTGSVLASTILHGLPFGLGRAFGL